MSQVSADRIRDIAWASGDERRRCFTRGHLECESCGTCACADENTLDSTEYPSGRVRVSTDKRRRSLCRECRYQANQMLNF